MILYSTSDGDNATFHGYQTDFKSFCTDITQSMWSPGIFKDNHRKKANFEKANILALDFDEGLSLEDAKERFRGFRHIIGTTRSHQKEKHGKVCDRFRVVLFLEEAITDSKTYEATVQEVLNSNTEADTQAKDAARMFYPCSEIISYSETGTSIPIIQAVEKPKNEVRLEVGVRGELTRESKNFLLFGAEPGTWNSRLYKAAVDSHNQGYTQEEFEELAGRMAPEPLDEKDLTTIQSAFNKDPSEFEHELRIPDEDMALLNADVKTVAPMDLFNNLKNYFNDFSRSRGISTGLIGLDKLLGGGLRLGDFIALVAEAGAGKSTLIHAIQLHLAQIEGQGVGYLSQEMDPAEEVLPQYLSMHFKRNIFKEGIQAEYEKQYIEWLEKLPIKFTRTLGQFPIEDIKAWILHNKREHGINFYFLDHFSYSQKDPENYQEASVLARELRVFARMNKVNIFSIIQPKNPIPGQKLTMHSMRGGAAINQAVDFALIMDRVQEVGEDNVNEIRCVKGRSKLARRGKMYIQYNHETTSIEEVDLADKEEDELGIREKSFAD